MIHNELLRISTRGKKASTEPVIDELTRKMTAAWRRRRTQGDYHGRRVCCCGASGDDKIHWVTSDEHDNGFFTTSLCVHYLAFHRKTIPQKELDKVHTLVLFSEEEPTREELIFPVVKIA